MTSTGKITDLRFGEYGVVLSDGEFAAPILQADSAASIEIYMQPGLISDSNTFLSFYPAGGPIKFSLNQRNTDLLVERTRKSPSGEQTLHGYADLFRKDTPILVTVTGSAAGTRIYRDGILAIEHSALTLSASDLAGRLIIGDRPFQNSSWSGHLWGLAIYHRALAAQEVLEHYRNWTRNHRPGTDKDPAPVGLFLFDEGQGAIIRNHAEDGPNLLIPARYTVLDEARFTPPSWSGWKDLLVNVGGFIPFGFCLCAYLSGRLTWASATTSAILIGFAASFLIEYLQAFLPTRDSDTTDVMTNTLGSILGALLYWNGILRSTFQRLVSRLASA